MAPRLVLRPARPVDRKTNPLPLTHYKRRFVHDNTRRTPILGRKIQLPEPLVGNRRSASNFIRTVLCSDHTDAPQHKDIERTGNYTMAELERRPSPCPVSLEDWRAQRKPCANVNDVHAATLTGLDRLAVLITDKVGTMGFFLTVFTWTVLWCGYNIVATQVPALRWKSFDPFPAFVAYLLISNVIQILLMPLIMVGQNLQGRHSELRAEHDLQINIKAEDEIEMVLMHLEYQQSLLIELVKAQGIKLDEVLDREMTA